MFNKMYRTKKFMFTPTLEEPRYIILKASYKQNNVLITIVISHSWCCASYKLTEGVVGAMNTHFKYELLRSPNSFPLSHL